MAAAESKGQPVSGTDVVTLFARSGTHILGTPAFKAGLGGVVRFALKLTINKTLAFVRVFVRFPKTEAGIPEQIAC